jgi:hypothetical protein
VSDHIWLSEFGCLFICACTGHEKREAIKKSPLEDLQSVIESKQDDFQRDLAKLKNVAHISF